MSLTAAVLSASLITSAAPSGVSGLLEGWRYEPRTSITPRLSSDELRRYSGVGALHCTVDGRERIVTAFLVGAFDVVVTVAHAFEDAGRRLAPSDCTFINTGPDGRVVERIGVAEFRSKWIDDPSTRGSPTQDIAVARLERISDYAQRTLPFKKFDGNPRDVTIVGYHAGHGGEWIKGKSHALADAVELAETTGEVPQVVWVDRSPQPTASGAPVIDVETGAVIGINQVNAEAPKSGNLLVIDEWLTRAILTYTRDGQRTGS